ncbi:hypothetical protein Ahy_B10g101648 [Arachis hypogaea]|uniref:Uncharacterized protein n=1 Tax=Arachis hypogaea TaxID=3818 RepID=A0A444X091_ARAHY|nr:hypothetical protein Ahy_B10g101648 [Arachis hypogaea]
MATRRLTRATASTSTPPAPAPVPAAPTAPAPAPAPAPAAPAPALSGPTAPTPALAAPAAPADSTLAPATAPVDRHIGKRGPSRVIATNRVIKTKTNGKLELPISLENLAPNGIYANLFASEVGIVTRQNAPLDVEKWSLVGDDVKQKICDLVLEKFDIADTQEKSLRNKDNRKHHVVPHIVGRRTFQVIRRDRVNNLKVLIWSYIFCYVTFALNYMLYFKLPKNLQRHPRTGVEPDIQELWQITHQNNNGE